MGLNVSSFILIARAAKKGWVHNKFKLSSQTLGNRLNEIISVN